MPLPSLPLPVNMVVGSPNHTPDMVNTNSAVNALLDGTVMARFTLTTFGGQTFATGLLGSMGFGRSGSLVAGFEPNARQILRFAYSVCNLTVAISTAQDATGSLVFTVLKNGTATAVVLTIAAGSGIGSYTDATHVVSFLATDAISVQIQNNALVTSAMIQLCNLAAAAPLALTFP